jgi:hypothetical protein
LMLAKLRRTHTPLVYVQRKSLSVLDIMNLLLNLACASGKIESLLVQEEHKPQKLRPQLHILLQSSPGYLKTTILQDIGRAYNVTPCSYATYASMIGTIDRFTQQIIPGLVWETRRKPLLLDEFRTGERGDAGSIDVLLGVLESGQYKRRIAVQCQPFEEKDGALYYRASRNGEIEVQTSFPCIIATMKNLEMSRSDKIKALVSRCIPVRYKLEDEIVDDALQGATLYHPQKLNPPQSFIISKRDYRTILSLASDLRANHKELRENYTRAVGDMARIYAILGRHDEKLYRLVCFLKAGYSIDAAMKLMSEESH